MTAALGGAAGGGVKGMKETSNIEHPTTNIQCGRAGASLEVRGWWLDVFQLWNLPPGWTARNRRRRLGP
jgi:hypothetical protein